MINSKPKVYFDTNALNFFCDTYSGRSKSPFRNFDILLSWPLVDEIECNTSFARTIDLAKFVWSVSNRNILLTIKDLVSIEVSSLINNITLSVSDYFDLDKSYITALNEARKGKTPNQTRLDLRSAINDQKNKIKLWEQSQRKKWKSHFGINKSLPNDWKSFFSLLSKERYFNQALNGMIETYGLSQNYSVSDVMKLDHSKLSCLSIGIEFYVALQFVINSQTKKIGSPDRGDLPDIQHSFYAGLCDFFVTNDERVFNILKTIINTKPINILRAEEFYNNHLLSTN
jgi:hypothetical protein